MASTGKGRLLFSIKQSTWHLHWRTIVKHEVLNHESHFRNYKHVSDHSVMAKIRFLPFESCERNICSQTAYVVCWLMLDVRVSFKSRIFESLAFFIEIAEITIVIARRLGEAFMSSIELSISTFFRSFVDILCLPLAVQMLF